jgi:predicted acyltransferase
VFDEEVYYNHQKILNFIKSASRFLALDVFRGLTVCFMIIVNTPGDGATAFAPLLHADWNGFTPTDLVFPSFLFAVGNAMSFSMEKYRALGDGAFFGKVIKRTLLIFLLGYLMYWFPFFTIEDGQFALKPLSHTRVMGVLQRIALCYFFASLIIRYFSSRGVMIASIVLLFGYWLLLLAYGMPGDVYGMQTNAGYYLDKFILGENHLYHGEGVAFDPEGILSTLPSIVNVIIGYYAGKFIQQKGKTYETVARLFLTGGVLVCLALIWNTYFPINKKLWSSSFVLLTTGIDLTIIAGLIYLVEIQKAGAAEKGWTKFFTVFGKNPLFIYLLSELLAILLYQINVTRKQSVFSWINNVFFQRVAPGPVGSLFFALSFMMLCWSVGLWLDKRKVYIRV